MIDQCLKRVDIVIRFRYTYFIYRSASLANYLSAVYKWCPCLLHMGSDNSLTVLLIGYIPLQIDVTHYDWGKVAAVFQTTFWNGFSWIKMHQLRLIFHWSLFPRVQLTIFQHWFKYHRYHLNRWWLVHWRIYASPGLNELNVFHIFQINGFNKG